METRCIIIKGRRTPKKEISTSVIVHHPPVSSVKHDDECKVDSKESDRLHDPPYPQGAQSIERGSQKSTRSGCEPHRTASRSLPILEGVDKFVGLPLSLSCGPAVYVAPSACDPGHQCCDGVTAGRSSPTDLSEPEYSTADEECTNDSPEPAKDLQKHYQNYPEHSRNNSVAFKNNPKDRCISNDPGVVMCDPEQFHTCSEPGELCVNMELLLDVPGPSLGESDQIHSHSEHVVCDAEDVICDADPEHITVDPDCANDSNLPEPCSFPRKKKLKRKRRRGDDIAVVAVDEMESLPEHISQQEASTSHDDSNGSSPVFNSRQVFINDLMDNLDLMDNIDLMENLDLSDSLDDSGAESDVDSDVTERALYLSFPYMGELQDEAECSVCLDMTPLYLRYCCRAPVCESCLNDYCKFLVENGNIKFPCPDSKCNKPIYQDEVFTRLNKECKMKLYRYLINANTDPLRKTCPRCTEVITLTSQEAISHSKVKRRGHKVKCEKCDLDWCFLCQSPWHDGISCKQNRKGDKLLKKWAKEVNAGQVNARKCPHCKVFIQRRSGCDHMTCSKCGINFCYRCGERLRSLKFIGDHYNKFSIFGCKYRLLPNRPVLRKFVRGSIFSAKLLVAPIVGGLALIAGAGVLAGAVIGSPILVGLVIRRRQKRKRLERDIREMREHDRQHREKLHQLGDPYMANYLHMQSIRENNQCTGNCRVSLEDSLLSTDQAVV